MQNRNQRLGHSALRRAYGIGHIRRVHDVPKGHLTPDERLVLLVLADATNDTRLEWGHDREVLFPRLGLDPSSKSDQNWLRIRLGDLDDARFIKRRPQKRTAAGTWERVSIKLELSAFDGAALRQGALRPTRRAAKNTDRNSRRVENLGKDRQAVRDEAGRFAKPGEVFPESPPLDLDGPGSLDLDGPVTLDLDGEPPLDLDRPTPTDSDKDPDITPTVDAVGVEFGSGENPNNDPDRSLEDRKRRQLAGLQRLDEEDQQ